MRYAIINLDTHEVCTNPNDGQMMLWDDKSEAEHYARESRLMSGENFQVCAACKITN